MHTSGPHQAGRIAVRIFREDGVDHAREGWCGMSTPDHSSLGGI